jgi:outer membrane protein assembly factor BamA
MHLLFSSKVPNSSAEVINLFLSHSLTGGSIVGDMAPYQAFAIGGLGSVRGYGEGAVGAGRLCLIANCEYTVPLVCMKHYFSS